METEQKVTSFPTEELLRLLRRANSFEQFWQENGDKLTDIRLPEMFALLLDAHQLTRQQVIEGANLERSSGYQIFCGTRHPRRDTLLRIAIAMRLMLNETQQLLRVAQLGELYAKNRRDAVIIYCLEHRLDLIEAELMLEKIKEPSLK